MHTVSKVVCFLLLCLLHVEAQTRPCAAIAQVRKVSIPPGNEAGWNVQLQNNAGVISQLTTTGSTAQRFSTTMPCGQWYQVVEIGLLYDWDLLSSQNCGWTVSQNNNNTIFTCVITNQKRGRISVGVDTEPAGALDSFSFRLVRGPGVFQEEIIDDFALADLDAVYETGPVEPNRNLAGVIQSEAYQFSLTNLPNGWAAGPSTCNDSNPDATQVSVQPAGNVYCRWTFKKYSNVVIKTQTIPATAVGNFGFVGSLGENGATVTTPVSVDNSGEIRVSLLAGNSATLGAAPVTSLFQQVDPAPYFDLTSVSCTQGSVNSATRTATIGVVAGVNYQCTFVNTQRAQLVFSVIEQSISPVGGTYVVTVTGSDGKLYTCNAIANTPCTVYIPPGVDYTVAISYPSNGYITLSPACTGAVSVQAGSVVQCPFVYTKYGKVVVEASTIPSNALGQFTFTGIANGTIAGGQNIVVSNVVPDVYTIKQATGSQTFDLASIVCSDADSNGNYNTGNALVRVDAGETVTCTFQNTRRAEVVVSIVEENIPSGTSGTYTVTLTGTSGQTYSCVATGSSSCTVYIPPGVSYTTTVTPTDGGVIQTGSGGACSSAINPTAGQTVACSYSTTLLGSITIGLQTLPAGATDIFQFQGAISGFLTDGKSLTLKNLAGSYTISQEILTHWDITSITCTPALSASVNNVAKSVTVALEAGKDVSCTFQNTRRAQVVIAVDEDNVPNGIPGTYTAVLTDATGKTSTCTVKGGATCVLYLPPGVSYTTTLTPTTGGVVSSGSGGVCASSFTPTPGQAVTCGFSSTLLGTIVIGVQTLPGGVTDIFKFTGDVSGFLTDGKTIVAQNLAGSYSISQDISGLTHWDITSIDCSPSASVVLQSDKKSVVVTLQAGKTVTCTYTNTKRATIVVPVIENGASVTGGYTVEVTVTDSQSQSTLYSCAVTSAGSCQVNVPSGQDYAITANGPNEGTGAVDRSCLGLSLSPGQVVQCPFTFTVVGVIVVAIQTVPASTSVFQVSGDVSASIQSGSTAQRTVAPGVYSVQLADPSSAYFSLGEVSCSDSSSLVPSVYDLATRTITFNIEPAETVKCDLIIKKWPKVIVYVQEDNLPTSTPGEYTFTLTGSTNPTTCSVVGGGQCSLYVPPAQYTADLTTPPQGAIVDQPPCQGLLSLSFGQTLTCTFATSLVGTFGVAIATIPSGSAGTFQFTGDLVGQVQTGGILSSTRAAGNYLSTQSANPAFDVTSVVCNGTSRSSGSSAYFSVVSGGVTICTFTNTKRATVTNNITPNGDSFPGGTINLVGDNGDVYTCQLSLTIITCNVFVPPGTYTPSIDLPVDWVLTPGGACSGTVTLVAGQSLSCDWTISQLSRITITNQLVGSTLTDADSAVVFSFSGDINGNLLNGGSLAKSFTPGTYSVAETDPSPAFTVSGIVCNDTSRVTVDLANRAVQFRLTSPGNIQCIYYNRKVSAPAVPTSFALTLNLNVFPTDANVDVTVNVINGGSGATQIAVLSTTDAQRILSVPAGTYQISPVSVDGWEITQSATSVYLDANTRLQTVGIIVRRYGQFTLTKALAHTNTAAVTFTYTGSVAGTVTTGNVASFTRSLTPGSYSTVESLVDGWKLSDISCTPTGSVVSNVQSRSLTFDINYGDILKCTFTSSEVLIADDHVYYGQIRLEVQTVSGYTGTAPTVLFECGTPIGDLLEYKLYAGTSKTIGPFPLGGYTVFATPSDGFHVRSQTCYDSVVLDQSGQIVICSYVIAQDLEVTKTVNGKVIDYVSNSKGKSPSTYTFQLRQKTCPIKTKDTSGGNNRVAYPGAKYNRTTKDCGNGNAGKILAQKSTIGENKGKMKFKSSWNLVPGKYYQICEVVAPECVLNAGDAYEAPLYPSVPGVVTRSKGNKDPSIGSHRFYKAKGTDDDDSDGFLYTGSDGKIVNDDDDSYYNSLTEKEKYDDDDFDVSTKKRKNKVNYNKNKLFCIDFLAEANKPLPVFVIDNTCVAAKSAPSGTAKKAGAAVAVFSCFGLAGLGFYVWKKRQPGAAPNQEQPQQPNQDADNQMPELESIDQVSAQAMRNGRSGLEV